MATITATTEPRTHWGLREQSLADHRSLSGLFDSVVDAFRWCDREEADRLFRTFERQLEEHFRIEEAYLLPALMGFDPAEVSGLLADHRRIRERVTALGVGVDLHVTNATAVTDLIEELRRHTYREDALLARLASEAM